MFFFYFCCCCCCFMHLAGRRMCVVDSDGWLVGWLVFAWRDVCLSGWLFFLASSSFLFAIFFLNTSFLKTSKKTKQQFQKINSFTSLARRRLEGRWLLCFFRKSGCKSAGQSHKPPHLHLEHFLEETNWKKNWYNGSTHVHTHAFKHSSKTQPEKTQVEERVHSTSLFNKKIISGMWWYSFFWIFFCFLGFLWAIYFI